MPTFTASAPASIRALAPSAVATLPAITSILYCFLMLRTVSITFLRVAVGGVDDDHVDVGLDQGLDPLVVVHAGGGPDPQPAAAVLAGHRELPHLLDIPHGDQAGQLAVAVDQQQFLDLGWLRMASASSSVVSGLAVTRLFLVITSSICLSSVSRNFRSRRVRMPTSLPSSVVIGTPETLCRRITSWARETASLGPQGDRVEDHAALAPLDLVDLAGLGLGGHVLVDDPDAAFLGQGDRQGGLGDGVHRRGDQRDVDGDAARQLGADVHLAGDHFAVGGHEQDIIESDGVAKDLLVHVHGCYPTLFSNLSILLIRPGSSNATLDCRGSIG